MNYTEKEIKDKLNKAVVELLNILTGAQLVAVLEEGRLLQIANKDSYSYEEFLAITIFDLVSLVIAGQGARVNELTKH